MKISDHLKLEAKDFEQVLQYLGGTRHTWLLVLDNADDPSADFQTFFPPCSRVTVIMTSRNPECGRVYGTHHWEQLDVLGRSLATNLLMQAAGYKTSSDDRVYAEKIVKALESHTLAVILAGSYVATRRCGLENYLYIYEKHWLRTVKYNPGQSRSRYGSVHATFEASTAILESENNETSRDALELLNILSASAPSNVPLSVFEEAWRGIARIPGNNVPDSLDDLSDWHVSMLPSFLEASANAWDPYRLDEACSLLEGLSLLTVSEDQATRKLSMHPLLHDWTWRRQTREDMEKSWATTGSAFSIALHRNEMWYDYGKVYRSHLGTSVKAYRTFKLFSCADLPVLQILFCFAAALDEARDDSLALACLDTIAEERFRESGATEALHLGFMKLWASCRLRNGDAAGSVTLWNDILNAQASLAEDHPSRLASQHALAGAYQANGQVKDAVTLLQHVVKVH
jgi:hypothetical protein